MQLAGKFYSHAYRQSYELKVSQAFDLMESKQTRDDKKFIISRETNVIEE